MDLDRQSDDFTDSPDLPDFSNYKLCSFGNNFEERKSLPFFISGNNPYLQSMTLDQAQLRTRLTILLGKMEEGIDREQAVEAIATLSYIWHFQCPTTGSVVIHYE